MKKYTPRERKEYEDNYFSALLNFWNHLMNSGYLEEGLNGKELITDYVKRRKNELH